MPEIRFDLENQSATFTPPGSRIGALTSFSDTKLGLTTTIRRGASSFDIVGNTGDQQKGSAFGNRSLDPFFRDNDPTPFTASFSAGVYQVSVTMGDYGDDDDVLSLKAYSGQNRTGNLLGATTDFLPAFGQTFTSKVLTVTSETPIRSIEMIGGSPEHRNSMFYDNIVVNTSPSPTSDNTLTTARNLGTLSGTLPINVQDFVGSIDSNDYYLVSLASLSNLSLSLTGLRADADVQVFDSSGFLLNGSYNSSSTSEALSLTHLAAGNYYVRVYQFAGDTPYALNLSSSPIDQAGDSLSTARNVGSLGLTSQVYQDWLGNSDANDYYRLSIAATRDLNVVLNGLSANADLQLIRDANNNGIVDSGDVLRSSTLSGTTQDAIAYSNLSAGTYFVRVYQASGNTNYQLTLSATPPDLAGNTPTAARNLGILSATAQVFSDFVGNVDSNDYYRFTVNSASNLSLQLSGLLRMGEIAADADVQLLRLNSNGTTTLIQTSNNSGIAPEVMSVPNLAAGTYLVRVYQYAGDTTYNLRLSATPFLPVDNAGNTLATARHVGTLSSSDRSFSDWVGTSDPDDYYRFNLASISNLSLVLNGLGADADLELIQDTNNNGRVDADEILAISNLSGIQADTIRVNNLAAGSYFARVYNFDTNNTFYNLNLSAAAITTGDWFDQHLRDTGLISLTRSLAIDNQLSRNDMIAIFRNAQDGALIDATEQGDLQTIVRNYVRFNMLDYVRYLSQQVASSISTNMSATAEEALIGRHFLGTVTPQDSYTSESGTINFSHVRVEGTLFGSSGRARIDDIVQGHIGNCAFVAALGAVVYSRPDIISSMIIDNGDDDGDGITDTYTIRFYPEAGTNPTAEYVTVDRRLAVADGKILFAAITSNNSSNVLWAALVERAYAQWREFREGSNGYNSIGSGDGVTRPVERITGRSATSYPVSPTSPSFSTIQNALLANRPVIAGCLNGTPTTFIVKNHAYSVVDAFVSDRGEQRIIVRNPWGIDGRQVSGANDGYINLSFSEFLSSFTDVGIA